VYQQRVVIVGAGIVGLSTAYALLKRGVRKVIVLEQESVDHARSTSRGPSRLLRFEYGSDALYAWMVQMSLQRWRHLERMTKHTLYTQTGLLLLGTGDDNYTLASHHLLQGMGQPSERLSEQHCRQRFPQFATHNYDVLAYNSEAGILHASTCLRALKSLILDLGGEICEFCRVSRLISDVQAQPVRVHLDSGGEVLGDRVVLATGPWIQRLLGNERLPVHMTRQHLLYFAGLSPTSFGMDTFPAFIAHDLYGFPLQRAGNGGGQMWLKAASHSFGSRIEPDDISAPDEHIVAQVARRLRELLPALRWAELAHVDSCMYDVTPDQDFILDRLPSDPRIVFATGLTGHGFKFGPLLGELLSSMVCDTQPVVPLERFQLARFTQSWVHQGSSVA
jgi:monomeric sarcosine oxidase